MNTPSPYTLKIAWTSVDENGILADESTLFIPADLVRVHGSVTDVDGDYAVEMSAWDRDDWHEYRCVRLSGVSTQTTQRDTGKLIMVERDGVQTWYVASRAWLLGPLGSTIERVAP